MSENVQINKAVETYIRMRDRKAEILREAKHQAKEIETEMAIVANFVTQRAHDQGVEGFRTKSGKAFFTTKTFVKSADWDSFLAWVDETEQWPMLEKRPAKLAVLEYVKQNDGAVPPGLSIERFKEMVFER